MNIAIIPARSGSKGFKDKNIAKVNDITLIEYAIKSALSSKMLDHVYISTDSIMYEEIALNAGAKSLGLRSSCLSDDKASTINVVTSIIKKIHLSDDDHVVLLQPTSPLRSGYDIDECIAIAEETGESVVSVSKIDDPHPFKLKKIDNGRLVPFIDGTTSEVNRQSLPTAYCLTGAIYVAKVSCLHDQESFFSENTQPFIVDKFVNIDNEDDFLFLKFLVDNKKVEMPL